MNATPNANKAAAALKVAGATNASALAGPTTQGNLGTNAGASSAVAGAAPNSGLKNAAKANANAQAAVAGAAVQAANAQNAAAKANASAVQTAAVAANATQMAAAAPTPANMNNAARAANNASVAAGNAAKLQAEARATFKALAKELKAAGVSANNLKRNVNNA
jgi:hypothetical protein